MRRIVAGDIGGTKTLLQLLELRGGGTRVVLERRYESQLFPSFDALLEEFFPEAGACEAACFAVAGPVVRGMAHVTNLSWEIDAEALETRFGIPAVKLVNDFHAVAAGVPHLAPSDVVVLNEGRRDALSPIAILGAGTGLGEAMVVPRDGQWIVMPSEGGHTDFAPSNERQDALLRALRARYGHVSWERVVSGMGIAAIVTWLRDSDPAFAAHDFTAEVEEDDLPAAVARHDADGNPLARATLDLFIDAYGAEAGNLALKCLARGGVYLAGGIAAKNVARFQDGRFMRAFADKGRFSDLVLECPVGLIANANVGLIGAAMIAKRSIT